MAGGFERFFRQENVVVVGHTLQGAKPKRAHGYIGPPITMRVTLEQPRASGTRGKQLNDEKQAN